MMLRIVSICLAVWIGGAALAQGTAAIRAGTAPESCAGPEPNMTSGDYLVQVATCLHGEGAQSPSPVRVALVSDIHIKSWSYALINKTAFWSAVLLAVVMLAWPSFVALSAGRPKRPQADPPPEDAPSPMPHWTQRPAATSAIQTTIAALAALAFAFYAHYKGNQVKAENLMREIIFAEELSAERVTAILSAIAEMDKGFGFTSVAPLKPE